MPKFLLVVLPFVVACGGALEPERPDASPPADASACLPRLAADGVRRCLPPGAEGEEYFRPALCGAAPIAVIDRDVKPENYVLTSAPVAHLDAPARTRVFDGARPSADVELCQWHGDVCACRPVREGETVYAAELPPTAFPAAT